MGSIAAQHHQETIRVHSGNNLHSITPNHIADNSRRYNPIEIDSYDRSIRFVGGNNLTETIHRRRCLGHNLFSTKETRLDCMERDFAAGDRTHGNQTDSPVSG
ncbi:hypothetical protein HID58_038771 [Brassica napus]|uniref:Uncharacterized protein n=1 Tax=Brassica napus TaxID=3708 RepID=A0ABQ8BQ74_BRANA|nr:hypothetical protein HID58_038771 [Brassica napus]